MDELPPHVKAYADELLAVAPPLTRAGERAIQALALASRDHAEPLAA